MSIPFELELLSQATNYQKWVARTVNPFLGHRILEVGAGIGNMSKWLPCREKLVLSEADPALVPVLQKNVTNFFSGNPAAEVKHIDLTTEWHAELAPHNFDTVISFNVLEHIEDDAAALERLLGILKASRVSGPKRLVTFVPAHPFAYGEMDRTFSHFRRYARSDFKKLHRLLAPEWRMSLRHFNVIGLPSWIVLGRIFRRKQIGAGAVQGFEKICPHVSGLDDFLHETLKLPLGQSLLCVWESL